MQGWILDLSINVVFSLVWIDFTTQKRQKIHQRGFAAIKLGINSQWLKKDHRVQDLRGLKEVFLTFWTKMFIYENKGLLYLSILYEPAGLNQVEICTTLPLESRYIKGGVLPASKAQFCKGCVQRTTSPWCPPRDWLAGRWWWPARPLGTDSLWNSWSRCACAGFSTLQNKLTRTHNQRPPVGSENENIYHSNVR